MKTMNIKSTDYRVQITESGSVPGSVLAAIRKASVLCTLCSVLLISSCTHDEIIPPVNTTSDALALLPGNTPVEISAEVGEVTSRSSELTSITTGTYTMTLPRGASATVIRKSNINVEGVNTTNFPLYLKEFNLVEGNNRCVTRWALLEGDNVTDYVLGWARLTHNNGQPTLDFGQLKHANSKITLIVKDGENSTVDFSSGNKASFALQGASTQAVVTATGEELTAYLGGIKKLADDPTDASGFSLKVVADADADNTGDFSVVDGKVEAIVRPTPTGGALADTDKLTITIADDYSGLTSSQTGGTYSLKLSEVKLSDTENLTALEPGKHYTLTVTLRHNTLVAATATIGAWSTASANVNIGGDGAFMPSYTYDAASNTYNVYQSEGIEEALKARTDENSTLVYFGTTVVPSGVTNDKIVVLSGATTDLATVQTAIAGKTHIIVTGTELAAYNGTATTVVGEAIRQLTINEDGATDANSELTSTISLVIPDATTIGDYAFNGCSALKTLTFGSSIKSLGTDAFSGINAEISYNGIPLKMEAGELMIDKVTDNIYYSELPAIIANGILCVKVDGTCEGNPYGMDEDIRMMKSLIQSAIAKGVTGVYVTGTFLSKLQVDYGNQTVLGKAIEDFAIGTIDLIIPNVSSIPQQAFTLAPAIKSLTFGSVITSVGMGAFDDDYTPNCDLTLAAGHDWVEEGENKKWEGYTWKSITLK